jgi:hypothetical protein
VSPRRTASDFESADYRERMASRRDRNAPSAALAVLMLPPGYVRACSRWHAAVWAAYDYDAEGLPEEYHERMRVFEVIRNEAGQVDA